MNQEEFQLHVVSALAVLDTKMASLVGNGQPGRINKLETALEELRAARWTAGGIIIGISAVITSLPFIWKLLFKH